MLFYDNRLLADNSHDIAYLIFYAEIRKNVTKFVFCCSRDWGFKGKRVHCTFDYRIYCKMSTSLGKPRDAKRRSPRRSFYHIPSLIIYSYSFLIHDPCVCTINTMSVRPSVPQPISSYIWFTPTANAALLISEQSAVIFVYFSKNITIS